MSRFIRKPITIPNDVSVEINMPNISVKGPAGEITRAFDLPCVKISQDADTLVIARLDDTADSASISGTYWRTLSNMVEGAKNGIEKVLELVGVGYRAQISGNQLTLQLGYSNPVNHTLPAGVTATLPTQTEIVLKSADKTLLGQVAADIRACRPPEPYKGKGIRYRDERVIIKETKKK